MRDGNRCCGSVPRARHSRYLVFAKRKPHFCAMENAMSAQSMMRCESCGRQISCHAETCPYCGHSYVPPPMAVGAALADVAVGTALADVAIGALRVFAVICLAAVAIVGIGLAIAVFA